MSLRPRILLLLPHLGGGGAEKVFALLAQNLSQEKYELHLGLVTQSAVPDDSVFPAGVTLHLLGARRVRYALVPLLRLIWKLQPRVILSGMFHLNFLVLLLRPLFARPVTVLVRQNGTVSAAIASASRPALTRMLYRVLYRRADRIICQSEAMAADMRRELGIESGIDPGINPGKLAVLANPVDSSAIRGACSRAFAGASNEESELGSGLGAGPNLLAVGRLAKEKGFDLLLEALPAVLLRFPSARLVIAGEGPERTSLESLRRRLGLAPVVDFIGFHQRPAALFGAASVFVLSSRHEGMPNALLEAAAGGLPLVALPASGGIVDLLRGQPGAWLGRDRKSVV